MVLTQWLIILAYLSKRFATAHVFLARSLSRPSERSLEMNTQRSENGIILISDIVFLLHS